MSVFFKCSFLLAALTHVMYSFFGKRYRTKSSLIAWKNVLVYFSHTMRKASNWYV
jgi:hypothetical protein